MQETSDLSLAASSTEPSRSTFDELIDLLSNCGHCDQLSLDDQIEIGLLQLQVLESKNRALERSAKGKSELKQRLAEQERCWSELNSQLDEAVDLLVGLKTEVSQFSVGLEVAFEKKRNYLNFLLESARESTGSDSLRQFLNVHRSPDAESPYSLAMQRNYFQLNATKTVNYDLKSLARLAEEIESELKGICRFVCTTHQDHLRWPIYLLI